MDDNIDEIEDALTDLIQDEGLTSSRMALQGATIMAEYFTSNSRYAAERVTRALASMDDDKYKVALSNALGVERPVDERGNLSERRAALSKHEGFTVSEDTLRRWERKAIRVLARKIQSESKEMGYGDQGKKDYRDFTRDSPDSSEVFDGLQRYIDSELLTIKTSLHDSFAVIARLANRLEAAASDGNNHSLSEFKDDLFDLSVEAELVVERFAPKTSDLPDNSH